MPPPLNEEQLDARIQRIADDRGNRRWERLGIDFEETGAQAELREDFAWVRRQRLKEGRRQSAWTKGWWAVVGFFSSGLLVAATEFWHYWSGRTH